MASKKLHELLAERKGLNMQADKVLHDLTETFQKKENHFTKRLVTFTPNAETGGESVTEEQLDLQTTVLRELKWVAPFLIKSLNICALVEETNTTARADVILEDGTLLFDNVPVTSLLEMEKQVRGVRGLVNAIKTLDPSKGFQPDPTTAVDVYVARDLKKTRTKAVQKGLILHPGSDKIPAQVEKITEHVPIGDVTTQEWSGLITVAEKGLMLERLETLSRALKAARQRANDTVSTSPADKVGAKLINYVFGL